MTSTLQSSPVQPLHRPTQHKDGSVKIRVESAAIPSIEKMEQIVADTENGGRTFQVAKDVFDHFARKHIVVPCPPEDIERINKLLQITMDDLERTGMTRPCLCQHCGHDFSLADHVESSLRMGIHTRDELGQILTGNKYYLTVDTDRPRAILCVSCDEITLAAHCCYTTENYAYA